jgi:hypothetical protein
MADDIPQGKGYALRQSPSFGSLVPTQSSRGLRRANSDSGIKVSSRNGAWACSFCKYENVDPTNNRCALCGTQRQESRSKGILALGFSSYSSSASQKPSTAQKQNPSSTFSNQVARPVTPERGIDSGLSPVPVISRSAVDLPKSGAPTNGDKKSENIGSITEPNKDVFKKAEISTSSMEKAETSDKVAPLSSLKASADSISIQLLDLAGHNLVDVTSGLESQEFGYSTATIAMSNVHHDTVFKDIDTDSMGRPEQFDGASSDEVSLNQLYAMGADLTAQHMEKAWSPFYQSPQGVPQSREEDTRKVAWVPLVISISPDDHNKDLEANNFQMEDLPDEMIVSELEPQPPTSRMASIVRAAFVVLVLLIVVLSVTLFMGSDDDGDGSATDDAVLLPVENTVDLPTAAPVPTAPVPVTASPSPLPT